jgi:hypothetical protein
MVRPRGFPRDIQGGGAESRKAIVAGILQLYGAYVTAI